MRVFLVYFKQKHGASGDRLASVQVSKWLKYTEDTAYVDNFTRRVDRVCKFSDAEGFVQVSLNRRDHLRLRYNLGQICILLKKSAALHYLLYFQNPLLFSSLKVTS